MLIGSKYDCHHGPYADFPTCSDMIFVGVLGTSIWLYLVLVKFEMRPYLIERQITHFKYHWLADFCYSGYLNRCPIHYIDK